MSNATGQRGLCAASVVVLWASMPSKALADGSGVSMIPTDVFRAVIGTLETIGGRLAGLGLALFATLGLIELVVSGVRLFAEGGGFQGLGSWFYNRMLFLCFWALLLHGSPKLMVEAVDWFVDASGGVSGGSAGASGIMSEGFEVARRMGAAVWEAKLKGLLLIVPTVILAVVVAYATAEVLVATLVAYAVAYAGVFLLGFGGSRWTAGISEGYLRAVLGASVYLFVVNLVSLTGIAVMKATSGLIPEGDIQAMFMASLVLVFVGIVVLLLLKKVPDAIAGVVGGTAASGAAAGVMTTVISTVALASTAMGFAVAGTGRVAAGAAKVPGAQVVGGAIDAVGARVGYRSQSQLAKAGARAEQRQQFNEVMKSFDGKFKGAVGDSGGGFE